MSPIHDQGYRRYGGVRTPAGRAWSVIAKAGIRTLISKRAFIGLLLLSWGPFLVRAVQIYAATNLPQASFLKPDAKMFRQFLEQQQVFLFFITVYAGSGLIASDRRANALQIYLSKPLTRMEYIFGKMAILMSFLLLVTWCRRCCCSSRRSCSRGASRSSWTTSSCFRRSPSSR
jgi:ABC-2 type transport system permease protein